MRFLALTAVAAFATGGCATESGTEQEATMTTTIAGTITVEEPTSAPETAVVLIRLLDASLADASSITISEQQITNADLSAGELAFRLEVPDDLEASARYTVSVHADVDGSGDISVGDYITMESYPVTLDDSQPPVEVRIRPVRS